MLTESLTYTLYGVERDGPRLSMIVVKHRDESCLSTRKKAEIIVTENYAKNNRLVTGSLQTNPLLWSYVLSRGNFLIEIRRLKEVCRPCGVEIVFPHKL